MVESIRARLNSLAKALLFGVSRIGALGSVRSLPDSCISGTLSSDLAVGEKLILLSVSSLNLPLSVRTSNPTSFQDCHAVLLRFEYCPESPRQKRS